MICLTIRECIGTIWSCSDIPATVIPGLVSANAESAEDLTVDLSDNSSHCIGTSFVSVLLLDMVLMASDCRIGALVFLNSRSRWYLTRCKHNYEDPGRGSFQPNRRISKNQLSILPILFELPGEEQVHGNN
ncbi:uncharacterized protein [Malus domestica]|uniref:uncharacterized protein isoform X2 n=1 Tax=Malus domestica TaxID=3750 RepID=UPI0010AA5D3B|nr:uncharacterized protein LOC103412986 isoform X2 [Malus domestica]